MAALFTKSLCIFLIITLFSSYHSHAYVLEVGGNKGWTLNPTEAYSAWSHRLRFSVNDTLHFKYNAATDSVLVVSKDDFDSCNSNNPITKLDGGDSSFIFDRSGPFFFITGNKTNCDQGQKIHVVVLAIRNNQPPSQTPSSSPPAVTPASSPTTTSPAPGAVISPAPGTPTNKPADASAPAAHTPAKSSARATFNADSTVPFVMIFSLALALIVC